MLEPGMTAALTAFLDRLLAARLASAASARWLRIVAGSDAAEAMALAGRCAGHGMVAPTVDEHRAAVALVPGWRLATWTMADAARACLLLGRPDATLPALLADVARGAELGELVSLARSLAVLPDGGRFIGLGRVWLRSSADTVFRAVTWHNPWPAACLDEDGWNQLVLKALFTGSDLWRIQGLEARANPRLTAMLVDYARERRVAGRAVPPELWRPVAACADATARAALNQAVASADAAEAAGAASALGLPGAPPLRREEEVDP